MLWIRAARKGATLAELLISISIILILAAVSVMTLVSRKSSTELTVTTQQIAALLRDAQSRSLTQASGTNWGVRFANVTNTAPFYALFSSSTYNASATVGYYRLPANIAYVSSSVAVGSAKDVVFAQVTGFTTSTPLGIYVLGQIANSSTISVATSGAVSF